MGQWILAMASIVIIELTLSSEVSEFCRKRTSMLGGGEELICHNATLTLFKNPNLFNHKINRFTCENCTLETIDATSFNVTKSSINLFYLTSSKIYSIKEFAFSKLKLLRVLNLKNNSITDVEPKAFTNLQRLAQLDLGHNSIRILLNSMFEELPNLNLLSLNYNTIYYIQPEAFRGLSHLRHLYLNNNQIEKLDGFIFKYLPNLLLLYIENNNILEIDSFAFANLASLNSLYLNNNKIHFLTQYNFKPLSSLQDLQLRGNNLTEIQVSSFNGLTNLKQLYLGNNRLKTVKRYGFVGLDHLQSLDLINNDFELFELSYIEGMKNLNMLWLQQNRISNLVIDFKLDPLESLYSLGINDNNFTFVGYKLLYNKLPNLKDIFIFNNSWSCDLLVSMFGFFQEQNVTLCASLDCNFNKTKQLVDETCVFDEEQDREDTETDFVSGIGTCYKIMCKLESRATSYLQNFIVNKTVVIIMSFTRKSNQAPQSYVYCEVSFGTVPVGGSAVRTYPLKNKYKDVVVYVITRSVQTNPIYYVFDINTYEVKIEPGGHYLLKSTYTPNFPGSTDIDYFTVTDSLGQFHPLIFIGECAGPSVHASIRNLTFFDTPKNKIFKKVFTLSNTSKVDAPYQFDYVDEDHEVFKIEPKRGTLKFNEHQCITVKFRPKTARLYSRQLCCLILHHEPILLNLCGVCSKSGMYDTDPDLHAFRHYPLPFQDTVGFRGYFSDCVTMKYIPPPVSLTTTYFDFGRNMPERPCQILTTSFTNHLDDEVEVEWENVGEFAVFPEKLIVPPKQSALYECRFQPKENCKLSGDIINGYVSWSIPDHESPVNFNIPIPFSLRLIGHSFPPNQIWIPSITITPQNVILPLTMPTIPTWTTFMITAHGHLPVLFRLLPPSKTNFIMKPMVGLIRDYQIIAVQLETNSSVPRSYIEQWSIELNGQAYNTLQVYLKVQTDVPRVQIANANNCIKFDPIHPGTQACAYVPLKNSSYTKLQYEFQVRGGFNVDPCKGILTANEEIYVNVTYTSDIRENCITKYEMNCSLQCIMLGDIVVPETIEIPFSIKVEVVYTELCALPHSYECGEIERATAVSTCFYLYNFGRAAVNFTLVHNHDLKDVSLYPVHGQCGSRQKFMVKVEFTPRILGTNALVISYKNRTSHFSDDLTNEGERDLFKIEYNCVIPTFQIMDLLEHNFPLFSNKDLWELLKIDDINAALLETNPGEIRTVNLSVPEYSISEKLFHVVFAIKNVSNLSLNFHMKRRQLCDCKRRESEKSFTFRLKSFDCVHRQMLTLEIPTSIMPKNTVKPLHFNIRYLLPDKNILSYQIQLIHHRTIILNIAVYGIPQDSRILSILGEECRLSMGFVYIGLREPPVFAYWLYNNTDCRVSFKVDDLNIIKLCNLDGFPVLKCLNSVGFIQPHSSAPLLFKFCPIEVKPYEVSVPVQFGEREGQLMIEGHGTDKKNKFDFKLLKSVVTKPLRNPKIGLSINDLMLEPLLLSNTMERMFFITSLSKKTTIQYSWKPCFVDGLIKIKPSQTSGVLKPQESHPVMLKITSLNEPCRIKILLHVECVDLDEITEYQNKLEEQGNALPEGKFTMTEEDEVPIDKEVIEPLIKPQTFYMALPITVTVVGILDRDNCIHGEDQMKQKPFEGIHANVDKFVDEYVEETKVKERPIHPQPEPEHEEDKTDDKIVIDKEMTQSVLEQIVSDAVFSDYFKELLKSSETEPSPLYSQIQFSKRKREKQREKETRKFLTQPNLPDVAEICEEAIVDSLQKVFRADLVKRQDSHSEHLQ